MPTYKGKLNYLLNKDNVENKPKQAISQRSADNLNPEVEIKQTKGVRLDNKNSSVAKQPAVEVINIDDRVKDIIDDQKEMTKLTANLTQRIINALNDKTLNENKSPEEKELDKIVVNDYVKLARMINNTENQEEGIGNLSFIFAVAKCLFILKDRINEIEYKNATQTKVIDKLNYQISVLEDKVKK